MIDKERAKILAKAFEDMAVEEITTAYKENNMPEKKYAIVRADKFCPRALERNYKLKCIGSLHCDKCDLRKKYGDTKKQMILKVAQVLFEAKLEIYKNVYGIIPNDKFMKDIYAKQLKVAKKIIEFLGVK